MKRSSILALLSLLVLAFSLQAQTTKEEFLSDPEYTGGLYRPYHPGVSPATPPPAGYEPFYITHYGRHGSRWLLSASVYTSTTSVLREAEKAGVLTARGTALLGQLTTAAADAAERYGDLSPLGAVEQRGIAERMYRAFPEVFRARDGQAPVIHTRSTQVPRCILSMAAFDERLKELDPAMQISREASKRDSCLNHDPVVNRDTVKAITMAFLSRHFDPARFIGGLFADTAYARKHIADRTDFARQVFSAAINMPNLPYLNIGMMDVFTPDERFVLWQASNLHMYGLVGPSVVNGRSALQSASLLLNDIVVRAEAAINEPRVAADLRFGHDSYIIPLLGLMGVRGMDAGESDPDRVFTAWTDFKASPMGSNIQLIFYRNAEKDDVLVKVLHCEKETALPVHTDVAPYYHWRDVRSFFAKRVTG